MQLCISPISIGGLLVIGGAMTTVLALPVSLLVDLVARESAFGQSGTQRKPDIIERLERSKSGKTPKPTPTPGLNKRSNVNSAPSVRPRHSGRRSNPIIKPKLDVTLLMNEPEVEIFTVEGRTEKKESHGKTGKDKKLLLKLPLGSNQIIASFPKHPEHRQQIDVRGANMTIRIDYPKLQPTPSPKSTTSAPKPTPTPTPTPPIKPEEVINRYIDGKQTESITADEWQKVLAQISNDLKREPNNARLKAQELLAQGELAYLRKDYDQALDRFQQAHAQSGGALPESLFAIYGLSNVYLARNHLSKAVEAYQRAIKEKPDFALAYKRLGDTYSRQRKSQAALDLYGKAQKYGYSQSGVLLSIQYNEALNLINQKRYQEAKNKLEEIQKKIPDSSSSLTDNNDSLRAEILTEIGHCYEGLNQKLSANDSYLKAISFDSKAAWANYRLGVLLLKEREYARAVKHLDEAVKLFHERGEEDNRLRAFKSKQEAEKKLPKAK